MKEDSLQHDHLHFHAVLVWRCHVLRKAMPGRQGMEGSHDTHQFTPLLDMPMTAWGVPFCSRRSGHRFFRDKMKKWMAEIRCGLLKSTQLRLGLDLDLSLDVFKSRCGDSCLRILSLFHCLKRVGGGCQGQLTGQITLMQGRNVRQSLFCKTNQWVILA